MRGRTSPPTDEDPALTPFTPDRVDRQSGPAWLSAWRSESAELFASLPAPTEKDEIWRYSRIDGLDLDRFAEVAPAGRDADLDRAAAALLASAGLDVGAGVPEGVSDSPAADLAAPGPLGSVAVASRDFAALNAAFAPEPRVIEVAPGTVVERPIVVVNGMASASGTTSFPRTAVRAGAGAKVAIVELVIAPAGADAGRESLCVPVTEVDVEDGAEVALLSVYLPAPGTWLVANQQSRIGAEATFSSFSVVLGSRYARLRTDSTIVGERGASALRAAFLGSGDEMLDFRTLQEHEAPRSESDLLFKGAVTGAAHSVYSGMIRIRRGAVKSDARQTNHNLVLDEGAHADSVPNLDIQENDVRCSHGSTVGPVDTDQRYYLETRGVPTEAAEALIVNGFFAEIADRSPVPGTAAMVAGVLADRLAAPDGGRSHG